MRWTRARVPPVAAAGAGIFVGTYDLAALSLALPGMAKTWHLSSAVMGSLGALSLAGTIVGALVGGLLADRFGRRSLLLFDFATYFAAALGSALAPTLAIWALFRVAVGVGVGADFAIAFPYVAEVTKPGRSGRNMAWTMWAANFGMLLAYGLGAVLMGSPSSWRLLLGAGALLALPVLATRSSLPESPRWKEGHRTSLKAIAREVWRARDRSQVAVHAINWFCYQVGDQGLTLFLPLLLMGLLQVPETEAAWGSVWVKAVTIPAAGFTVWAIGRWGLRLLQVWGFLVRALSLLGLGALIFWRGPAGRMGAVWALCILAIAYAAGAAGPDKTTVMAPAQSFPTSVRASGQAITESFGRVGGMVGTLGYGFLSDLWGTGSAVAFLGVMALVGFAVSALFLPGDGVRDGSGLDPVP